MYFHDLQNVTREESRGPFPSPEEVGLVDGWP